MWWNRLGPISNFKKSDRQTNIDKYRVPGNSFSYFTSSNAIKNRLCGLDILTFFLLMLCLLHLSIPKKHNFDNYCNRSIILCKWSVKYLKINIFKINVRTFIRDCRVATFFTLYLIEIIILTWKSIGQF